MTLEEIENINKEIEAELKEAAFWHDGWDNLRKIIDQLEANENEAKAERYYSDPDYPSVGEQIEKMYKIQRDLK